MSSGEAAGQGGARRPAIRTSIAVQGARVHNLKNISVEIPRDQLTVVTGLSGSGKSSLAFDTVYAEGQRRYMESLSSYAKRFIAQVEKPDVDFVYGLSPVVSIEQKTMARNPRSTVGTLTDISSYLNLLFATIGEAHCPYTDEPVAVKTASQILESLLKLPAGAEVELRAPIFQVYGEDPEFIFNEVRKLGCRYVDIDGERVDLTDTVPDTLPGDPKLSAVVDRLVLVAGVEKQLKAAVEHALRVGDSLMSAAVVGGTTKRQAQQFAKTFGSRRHALVYGGIVPDFFMFNNPESACRTCGGIGTDKRTHPDLLITNPERSIREGCFLRDAFNYRPDNHRGYTLYSLAREHGFDLDTPWQALDEKARDLVLYGTPRGTAATADSARCQGAKGRLAAPPFRVPGHCRRHRAPLPLVPPARCREFRHGGVARPGDGRAHLPRLPRLAAARHAAQIPHRRQDHRGLRPVEFR